MPERNEKTVRSYSELVAEHLGGASFERMELIKRVDAVIHGYVFDPERDETEQNQNWVERWRVSMRNALVDLVIEDLPEWLQEKLIYERNGLYGFVAACEGHAWDTAHDQRETHEDTRTAYMRLMRDDVIDRILELRRHAREGSTPFDDDAMITASDEDMDGLWQTFENDEEDDDHAGI